MATKKRMIDAYTLAEEIESLQITVAGKPAKWNDAKHSVLRVIAEQPDLDAVEVMHGHWILEKEPDGKPYCFHCSVCDVDFRRIDIVSGYAYCPYCGAKMDQEVDYGDR